jgi:hypothetical protein
LNIGRGLYAKESEILNIAERDRIDVLFLQETDLVNFDVGRFALEHFDVYAEKNTKKTRVMTWVRKGSCRQVSQLNGRSDNRREVWLLLVDKAGKKTTVTNSYSKWIRGGQAEKDARLVQLLEEVVKEKKCNCCRRY